MHKIIGKRIPKYDAWAKVQGNTVFASDYRIPGMLIGKVLRSKYSAARILSIDITEAEKLPGVHAVLTAKDVPHNETVTKFGQSSSLGDNFEGMYRVLADGKVRFMGESIALVAAESEKIAEKALTLIKVEYEPLEGVFNAEDALKPGAYIVGEGTNNIAAKYRTAKGDVEKAFQQADFVIERTYRVPFVEHAYLETEAGVSWLDENGVINIRVGTQIIEHFRDIAEVLGLPHNKVRIIGTMMGGGFGGKEDVLVETYLALLTLKTKKPVKMVLSREESIIMSCKRHPYIMKYKTGFMKDGRVTALKADLLSECGAYSYMTPWVLLYSLVCSVGPYNIENVEVDAVSAYTNNSFASANRGFGMIQPNFAYESQMNEMAKTLGMDPLEIRQKNYLKQGDALATGNIYDRYVPLPELAEKALEALGEKTQINDENWKVGQGVAVGMLAYGRFLWVRDTANCHVRVETDGTVIVKSGAPDLGGGQGSVLCQIVAEELGVDISKVSIYLSDTAITPLAGNTSGSRQTYMSGNAALMAARSLRSKMLSKASEMLGVETQNLDIINGEVISLGGETLVSLRDVIAACNKDQIALSCEAQFKAPCRDLPDFGCVKGQALPDFTFGAYAVELAVDAETGQIKILRIVSCYDVGKALNLNSVEGQLDGGAVYAAGYALTEEVILENGVTKTPSFSEYLIPTSVDLPDVEKIILESETGLGPYGAKGIGEPPCNAISPAIVNAIEDAVGKRIYSLPVTPEKVVYALADDHVTIN